MANFPGATFTRFQHCYRVSFELFVESPSVSVRSSIFVLFHVLALNYEHSRLSATSGTPHVHLFTLLIFSLPSPAPLRSPFLFGRPILVLPITVSCFFTPSRL